MNMIKGFIIPIFFLLIFSYRLPSSFYPDTDFTRDIYNIIKIGQGQQTLLGPSLRIGLFVGPYYYYLFAPVLLLGKFDTNYMLYFNATLFAVALGFFFIRSKSFLGTAVIGITPIFLQSARHPGNAYSYLPLLLVFLTLIFYKENLKTFWLGLLAGVIVNFHPLTLIAIAPIVCLKLRKVILNFLIGFGLTFAPLAIFELKHNFIITRGFFIVKNYQYFLGQTTKPYFYFYSLILLITFIFVVYVINTKNRLILLIYLIILLAFFPKNLYRPSLVNMKQTEIMVLQVISSGFVDKSVPFNLLSIEDSSHKVVVGNEYRFAFRKFGYYPLEAFDYANAKNVIVFSKVGELPRSLYQIWELQQFGDTTPQKTLKSGNIVVYELAK